jgi:uncharacterized protein with beta-barrel porin domain
MKRIKGAVRMKKVESPNVMTPAEFGRSLRGTAIFVLPLAAAVVTLVGSPAVAACVQSGNTVTCSGANLVGFGTGAENNLALTVQSNGSITAANPINLGDGNAVTNNGAITVVGGGIGIQGLNSNVFTNAGTVTIGANSVGIYTTGDNNTLTNTGTISSTATTLFGVWVNSGNGNTVTNSGNIILTGAGSFGIADEGFASTITNSGTIKIGAGVVGGGDAVELGNNGKLTNTGTITTATDIGSGVSMSGGGTVINNGLIGASGSDGTGVWINGGLFGGNSTIVNNGMIEGRAYSLRSWNSNGNSITNNGTLDGQISVLGTGNSLVNAGLITITDPGTVLAAGDLSVGGTFSQTAQGTLALRVDNTGLHDGLYATGQLALNGTLRPVLQPGLYGSTTTYTNVLQSGASVTGQFGSVTSPSVFLSAAASYHASSVDLTLTRYGFGNVSGETANQRSIGAALESGYSTALTGSAATFFTRLLQAGSLRVLDQLSGEGTSGTQNTAFIAGGLFGQTMDSQMAAWFAGNRGGGTDGAALGYAGEAPNGPASAFNAIKAPAMAQPQWHAWAAGFGAGQQLSGNASVGSASFSDRAAGGAMGVDHLLNPDLLLGIAAGGSSATFSVDDRATSGRLEGGHIGAYAMQRFGASYLSAQIAYSHFNNSTTRTISGVGPDETAKGAFTSDQFGGRLEIGRSFEFSHVSVTPFAALQAARLWQGGYTETSTAGVVPGVLGLNYAAHAASSVPVFLGVKFDSRADFGNGMIWTPFVNAAWVHEFEPSREITASLNNVSVPAFTIAGARAASDAARLDLGSRLALNRWWELSARVTGEFSRQGQTYAGLGSLRANW